MRAVVITKTGGPEVLKVEERPDPQPGRGEVAIDVEAAGINFADIMARLGLYPDAPKTPSVVGYEVSGTVADLGEGVTEWREGDRVIAGTRFGGYASRVVVPERNLLPLPAAFTFEQGAAFPVNYGTAYAALIRYGTLQEGERVLIQAAAGGVGIAATQIAKYRGAEVWGTASPGKHDAIRGFGVDHPVDYTKDGWEKSVPKLDVVIDALGGSSFRRSYDLLRAGGRLVCFGASGAVSGDKRSLVSAARTILRMPRFNLVKQMSASKAVIGLNVLTLWDEFGSLDPWLTPLSEMIDAGVIKPEVSRSFPFDRAGDAHSFISDRRNVGKVVLTPESRSE
jgi:NADPH:quinone reductase-like Zn-dependent oxidoreductase